MPGMLRKTLVVLTCGAMVAGIAVWVIPGFRVVPYTLALLFRPAPSRLPIPVEGVKAMQFVDTWGAPRSGGRRHQGIDIFGARGTKIRSTTEGVVASVGDNRLGGRSVWVLGPGRYLHYYAHLEKFGDVKPGQRIHQGHFIGTVGDSGNARGTPPHLHYGIYKLPGGAACNPYPLLRPGRDPDTRTSGHGRDPARQSFPGTSKKQTFLE